MKQNLDDTRLQSSSKGSHLSLRAEFIWYSNARNSLPLLQMYLILSVSYLQIFFMSTRVLRDYTKNDTSSLRAGLSYLEDIFTFDNLFTYSKGTWGILLTIIILLVYFMVLILSFWTLRYFVKSMQKPYPLIIVIWSFFVQFHNPIFFFIISNFCGRIQKNYSDDNLNIFETAALNHALFVLSIVIFILNVAITLGFDLFLCDSLPSKNSMSSKNSHTDRLTIFQKLLITLFWRFLPTETFANWLIMALNLAISFLKHGFYYYTYPRYNIQTLKFNAYALALEASIVVMAPFVCILNAINGVNITFSSTIMIIVLVLPFLIVGIRGIIDRSLINILYASPNQLNPHKLVHRLVLLKEIKSYKGQFGKDKDHINKKWLQFAAVSSRWKDIFNEVDMSSFSADFEDKKVQNQAIRQFLEQANKRYPHNNLVKLALIRFYIKSLKLFPLAIAYLSKVNSFSFRDKLSVSILYFEIQKSISAHYKQTDNLLDMAEYLSTMKQFELFEEKVWNQLKLYKKFWAEYSISNPDTSKLFELSEQIGKQKKIINKQWHKSTFNKEYTAPSLLYACYLFTLDDSPQKGQQYLKTHNLFHRDKDEQHSHELSRKNLYSDDNFYVTVKTDSEHVGKIAKCSGAIRRILNYDPKSLIGTNVSHIMSTYMGLHHNQYILNYVKTGNAKFLNRIQSIFVKDKAGYLHKASQYTQVHPFFSQEIFLTAIIRPIKTSEEYILVTPQGQLDSTSSGIAEKLGLDGKKIPIASICPDFEKIDKVFNYFGSKHLNPPSDANLHAHTPRSLNIKEDEETLKKLYDKWNSEGEELKFFVPDDSGNLSQTRTFFCQISNYYFASDFIKTITIKSFKHYKADESDPQPKGHSHQRLLSKGQIVSIAEEKDADQSFDFTEIDEKQKSKETPHIINLRHQSQRKSHLFPTDHLGAAKLSATQGVYREGMGSVNLLSRSNFDKHTGSNDKKNKESDTAISSTRKVKIQFIAYEGSIGSTSSNQTQRNRIHNVVVEALKTKRYTKPAYIFLGLCLCLAAALFASQLALLEKVRSDLNTLEALGTTLDYANTAVDALLYLSRGARISLEGQIGIIDTVASATAASYLTAYRSALNVYLPILADATNGIWSSLETINEDFRNEVLDPNIDFYDINSNLTRQVSQSVNTLTGTVLLENKLLVTKNYYADHGEYYLADLVYVMLNACNDLLIENQNLATAVLDYIKTSIDQQHISLDFLFSGGIAVIFIGLCFVFIYSYIFYRLEVKRLNSFLRLSEQEISSIQDTLSQFEELLKSQEYKFIRQPNILSQSKSTVSKDKEKDKAKGFSIQRHKQSFKVPDTKRLQKTYFLKISYWVIILSLYTIYIGIVYKKVYDNGTNFESGINRLISVQTFLERMQICIVAFYALFIPDIEPFVENVSPQTLLTETLVYISQASTSLTKAYTLSDGTLDPVIKPIFSGNVCNFVSSSDLSKCLIVAQGAQNNNLFTVTSALYTLLNQKIDLFMSSDQSFESSQSICTPAFVEITPYVSTLRDTFLYMISQARDNFNNIYETLLHNLNIYLAVDMVLFWILFLAAWVFVVRYMMGYNNRMKEMLMVVPVRILVTNKSLKPLLMKTCKGKLDVIRNEF